MHMHWMGPSTMRGSRRRVFAQEALDSFRRTCATWKVIVIPVKLLIDLQTRMRVTRAFCIGALLLISLYFGATQEDFKGALTIIICLKRR